MELPFELTKESYDKIEASAKDLIEATTERTYKIFIQLVKESWIKIVVSLGIFLGVQIILFGFTPQLQDYLPLFVGVFIAVLSSIFFLIYFFANQGKIQAQNDLIEIARKHAYMGVIIDQILISADRSDQSKMKVIRMLAKHSPDAMYQVNMKKGKLITVNERFTTMTGWTEEEINQQLDLIEANPRTKLQYFVALIVEGIDMIRVLNIMDIGVEKGSFPTTTLDKISIRTKTNDLVKVDYKMTSLQMFKNNLEIPVGIGFLNDISVKLELTNQVEGLTQVFQSFLNALNKLQNEVHMGYRLISEMEAVDCG